MDLFTFDPNLVFSFFLTLFRVSLVMFLLPFFGGDTVPIHAKAALCLVFSIGVWPYLNFPGVHMPGNPWMIVIMLCGELLLGLILGLVVRILFASVQLGGQVIGFQMGFAMINVVDPITGISEAVTAHFLYMTTILTFLALNGHLYLLQGLGRSFDLVPPGTFLLNAQVYHDIVGFSGEMFRLAIRIAAPVMAAIFLVDLALGLISKAAPQMNVLFVGFPLKIGVGFLFLGIMFSTLSLYVQDFIGKLDAIYSALMSSVQ